MNILDFLGFLDVIIGVGITSFLYFKVLYEKFDYLSAILSAYFLNIGYSLLRYFFFGKSYIETFDQVLKQNKEIFTASLQNNQEQLSILLDVLDKVKVIYTKYYVGIWVATIVIAVYIGSLIISKKASFTWVHKTLRLPFFLVYLLIASLGLLLIPAYSVIGINILIMLVPLFLIQGSSILDFFWGNYFKRSKFLMILLIIAIVLNYFILLLVALIGLIDIWFNIRKLKTMEE